MVEQKSEWSMPIKRSDEADERETEGNIKGIITT